jgi:pyridinium-3,5-bisthiocarboxylic acid mononucleotide nickel chelatase
VSSTSPTVEKDQKSDSSSPTAISLSSLSSFPRKIPVKFDRDLIELIETNVDDVTGEILSRTIERALSEGAEDATAIPFLGKKGREGYTIRIVCPTDSVEKFAQLLVEETGTLGVKTTEYSRLIVPRKTLSIPFAIEGFRGNVSVKVAIFKGRILRIKPELSDCLRISESQKIPLRDVLEQVVDVARGYMAKNPNLLADDELQKEK